VPKVAQRPAARKQILYRALVRLVVGERVYSPQEVLPLDQTQTWDPNAIRALLSTEQMEILPEQERENALALQAEYERALAERAPLRAKAQAADAKRRAQIAKKEKRDLARTKPDSSGTVDLGDATDPAF